MPLFIPKTFGSVDQVVFFSSIAIGAFVGIYFAYFAPKPNHQEDNYLFGGRNMKTVPIALSLAASYLSGVALVGVPAEVYLYGMQLFYTNVFQFLVTIFYNTQFLPVFHGLQGLSINEYFEKRFDKRLRLLVSVMFFLGSICFIPPIMYVPGLAYEQITGYNKYWVTVCVCIVCIFYTSIGGLKAVVWTDAIQLVSMLTCTITVMVKGTVDLGLSSIWDRNTQTDRLEAPYIDLDPTVRQTIFSVLIGGFFIKLKLGYLNLGQIQRHQSLPTISHAKRAVWLMMGFQTFLHFSFFYIGLMTFAFYYGCDPITLKVVSAKDQIIPLYIMQTIGDYPGLTGIFLSGVFSASLSTVSTFLNTLSGVFVEDWIRGHTKWNPSEHEATWIMRVVVVVVGLLCVALVFVVAQLGTLLQVCASVEALFSGAIVTVFFTALFLPWASSTGALVGAAAALACIAPIVIGAQYSIAKGLLHFPTKPLSMESCTAMFNVSSDFVQNVTASSKIAIPYGPTRGDVWFLFRISHHYFFPLSVACGLLAAIVVTIFISRTDLRKLDRRLVAPISRRWFPKSTEQSPRLKHRSVTDGEELQRMLSPKLQLHQHK